MKDLGLGIDVRGKRIAVGLSGGVDSAVTAALLKRAGADVFGVFAKGWYPPGMPCTWAEDRRDAMRVAARLGIPFHTLDASAEYKKGVIDYLLAEYAAGRTPNPDAMCNREVKFGVMWRFAEAHGAEYLATGHYARIERAEGKPAALLRGIDSAKDQSYFLWAVPQKAIEHALFPLGGMHKEETRTLARTMNLPVAKKRDSQGVCFLGSVSVEDFLKEEFHPERGIARDQSGTEVGTHDGAILHTIGERVSLGDAAQGPWYVVSKDVAANVLVVSNGKPSAISDHNSINLSQSNWFADSGAQEVTAQYRYHGTVVRGVLNKEASLFSPNESLPEPIAAGQSLVLYDGERVIGGGIIGA